ncbi:MFS transporter [Francisella sp. 19X1-34]|uniref:MFS transporter n=1 Tax=Francisella sp. 19X1-34 TaxID=3087177 RepID=UPI002E36BE86|nr:MFS transporter [Francisella sp. 19X1-34]MED7789053.1 MFS transporter [Francisella sp. 19X1-34]
MIQRKNIISLIIATAFFMEMLDSTIVVTAVPKMADYFGINFSYINLAITAYATSIAVFLLIAPWISNRIGDKNTYVLSIAIFSLGSLLCGLSKNILMLVIAEIIQGAGAALMVPVGRTIIFKQTPKDQYLKAIAWMVWPALIAPVVGPVLGAYIVKYASWRYMFFINIPIGIVLSVLSIFLLNNTKTSDKEKKAFDFKGFIILAILIISVIFLLESCLKDSIFISHRPILIASLIITILLSVVYYKKSKNHIINISAFKIHSFRGSIINSTFFRITTGAMPFVIPLYFQQALGFSAIKAGSLLLIMFVGNLGAKVFVNHLIKKFGNELVISIGSIVQMISVAMILTITQTSPLFYISIILLINGVIRSVLFTSYMSRVFIDVPKSSLNDANAINNILFQLTFGMAVSLAAILLNWFFNIFSVNVAFDITIIIFAVIALIPTLLNFFLKENIAKQDYQYQ